jgi:hypothetical protein
MKTLQAGAFYEGADLKIELIVYFFGHCFISAYSSSPDEGNEKPKGSHLIAYASLLDNP